MISEENAAQEAVRKLREEGLEPFAYAGRGMYGAECVAVEVDSREDAGDLKAIVGVMPKTDSLGRNVVAYWPSLPWPDSKSAP